jgi:hypothetical protein
MLKATEPLCMNRTPAMRLKILPIFLLLTTPAAADAIDGDWCSSEGKHLTIHGPEITTPNRTTLKGNYHRHEFMYVSPAGDVDAGITIYLQLYSEEEMNFYRVGPDGKPGEPALWKRCEVIS